MAGLIGSHATVVSSGAERKKHYNITTTTTSLTGLQYTPTKVHVYHNGVRLVDGTDYTATDGTSITLTNAAENGDDVVVISYATFQVSDTVSKTTGGTFEDAITIDADGSTVLTVDRATSDGTIIDVQKDGTTVGSIGASSGNIFAGSGDTALLFDDGNNRLTPWNTNNTVRDGQHDLGYSGGRFKDLYLSGGVYLGGTGSANKLDDYEEGTWTPEISFDGGQTGITYAARVGLYTKIGNFVIAWFTVKLSNKGSSTGSVRIEGAPFTPSGSGGLFPMSPINTFGLTATQQTIIQTNAPYLELKKAGTDNPISNTDCNNDSSFRGTAIYRTSA